MGSSSGIPAFALAHVARRDRIALAEAWASSRQVPHVLVCSECSRPINPPRRYLGELEWPVCMTCVEASFRSGAGHELAR